MSKNVVAMTVLQSHGAGKSHGAGDFYVWTNEENQTNTHKLIHLYTITSLDWALKPLSAFSTTPVHTLWGALQR